MYKTVNDYYKEKFGCKVYKLSIDGGFTCPNRDGSISSGGCIFCSYKGAGFETLGEKLRTLVINSLLETNLGIPYMYLIYIAYRRRFTEQMQKREDPLSFRECIREENLRRVRQK